MEEVPLSGGSVAKTVVRVGDTVRRSVDRWSPAVHELLRHLEQTGFDGSPRFLGMDHRGREMLSWMDGSPASRPWPAALLVDSGLRRFARLLRRFHDAVAGFEPAAELEWWTGIRAPGPGEIVIHGDLGPWNTIWRDDMPVGLIDWDFAEPALAIVDVAEAAFFATPMRDDAHCRECGFADAPDRRRRLAVFCDEYGMDDRSAVLDAMEVYWATDIERTARLGPRRITPWAGFHQRGIHHGGAKLLEWLRANRQLAE